MKNVQHFRTILSKITS